MSERPATVILGLLAVSAAACGPEVSFGLDAPADHAQAGGDGGAAGSGGSGGGTVVADGGNDDAASDAGLGGTGGADDAGPVDAGVDTTVDIGVDAPPETCGPDGHGCVKLSVPLTDPQTGTFFPISLPATDLSGVSVAFRFCLVRSAMQGSGWVQPYAQEGVAPFDGQYDTLPFASIPACPTFLDYTFNFSAAPDPGADAGSPWFTRVQSLGLKIQSLDGATGSWANPTVVYVDSVMLSRRGADGGAPDDGGAPSDDGGALPPLPGPFTFDTSSSPFGVSTYQPVPGSALDWVP